MMRRQQAIGVDIVMVGQAGMPLVIPATAGSPLVIPATAGIQKQRLMRQVPPYWISACAGTTGVTMVAYRNSQFERMS
jgi:hypothetical protein